MKQVTTTTYCDSCAARGVQTAIDNSVSLPLSVGASGPQTLDLCEPCDKELVEPVRLLLAEYGQSPQGAERDQGFTCPGCSKTYRKRDGLAKHMERQHNLTLDARGMPVALEKDDDELPVEQEQKANQCPDCERSFDTPQGLGAHRYRLHAYVSPTKEARTKTKDKAKA